MEKSNLIVSDLDPVVAHGERASLAESALRHFAGCDDVLDLPDRSVDIQRPVDSFTAGGQA